MSRASYLIIAEALRKELDRLPHGPAQTVANAARCVATALGRDNRRFDPVKFALACGLQRDFSIHRQVDCNRNTRKGPSLGKNKINRGGKWVCA